MECFAARQGKWIAPRVMNLAIQYVTAAIKMARTWKILQPHIPQLMARVLLPLMCFNDEDAELWTDDPHEYVRKVTSSLILAANNCVFSFQVIAPTRGFWQQLRVV